MHYRANRSRPWVPTEETILHSVPSGKLQLLLPSNFHKINIAMIWKNIEKQQYKMAGEGECNWWLQYLEYLQLVKDNKDMLFDYAIREADWLLPNCMNRQKVVDMGNTTYKA